MTSGTGTEITLAELAKKIDDQARFTRSVSIICALAIIAVVLVTLVQMIQVVNATIPALCFGHFMGNLDKVVQQWDVSQSNLKKAAPNK